MFSSLWQPRRRRATVSRSDRSRFQLEVLNLEDRLVPSATTWLNEAFPDAGDSPAVAQALPATYPLAVTGQISVVDQVGVFGDQDYYKITVPSGGGRVWAYVDTGAAPAVASFDSYLQLLDTNGSTVLAYDDDGAVGNGGTILPKTQNAASAVAFDVNGGTYYLHVRQFSDSADIMSYRLYVNVTTGPRDQEPVDSSGADNNDDFAHANWLRDGTPLDGNLKSGSPDFYKFNATAGDRLWVEALAPAFMDSLRQFQVHFFDPNHNELLHTSDVLSNTSSGEAFTAFSYDVPTSGTYYAELLPTSGSSERSYSLLVSGTTVQTTTPPGGGQQSGGTPPAVSGTQVVRTGKAGKVTELTVTFNEPLDAARATNLAQYVLRVKRKGSSKPRQVTPQAVRYDAATQTLHLTVAFKPTDQSATLTIKGGTIADPAGDVLVTDLVFSFNVAPKRHK
jgi:hypothetical protein